jgi:acyl carrier protein
VLLGLRQLGVVPHGSFGARGFARAIERRRPRRARGRGSGARTSAWPARARCAVAERPRPLRARPVMTATRVLELIRRTWPTSWSSTRRAIDERRTSSSDLDADSLDLYTLVQELEDTYGVQMSDEQAARIQTVGAGRRLRARAPVRVRRRERS